MPESAPALLKTPLNAWHRANGGRMADWAGWELPAEYSGANGEHVAVRTGAGLFDLSHLGQVELAGKDALAAVQSMTCNDAGTLGTGQVQHSAITTPRGTLVADVHVCRLAVDHFLFVLRAPNVKKGATWVVEQAKPFGDAAVVNTSSRYSTVSLQGPAAREILQTLTDVDLGELEECSFAHGEVGGVRAMVSRTGWSGEDGYEMLAPPQSAAKLWGAILGAGGDAGVVPAGMLAYDTLRLEAGFPLHGADIDETTTVLEAGLERIVAWDKGEFIGRAALAAQRADGLKRRIVGFEMVERVAAPRGCGVFIAGVREGTVSSGAVAPFLERSIGMALLPAAGVEAGTEIEVDIQGRRAGARVASLPFYKRPKR